MQEFSAGGEFLKSLGSKGSGNGQFWRPKSIAFAANGNFWVADAENNRLEQFSEAGTFLKAVGSAGSGNGQFNGPESIAIDAKGNIWVADTYNFRVQELNAAGEFLKVVSPTGLGAIEPTGIDVGPGGNVWVADWAHNRVVEFSESGGLVRSFGSEGTGNGQFRNPDAVTVDNGGNVWVGDQSNERIQEFNQSGEYVTQFGSPGSGNGQFSFSYPLGIAADKNAGLWVADTDNNRIQRWSTALSNLSQWEAEVAAEVENPAVDVNVSSGLVQSVKGKDAGETTYSHTGELLTATSGPEGKTSYQYDGSGRMTKVSLPHGTYAEIAYEPTYGRVSSVAVSVEGAKAKTTRFAYTDEPRKTKVEPESELATTYEIAADGSVFKSANAKQPPVFDSLTGTLHDPENLETANPISPGAHNLVVQANASAGIASIQVVANNDQLVAEANCEKPATECETQSLQWATETEDWAPGLLYLEVVATDQIGQMASERFWVNIPYTPPPEAEAPQRASFAEILKFREEHGLDLDLKGNESAIDARIFDLMGDWNNPQTPAGEVARASWELWGVPLRLVDVAELEYRQSYMEHDLPLVEEWSKAHASGTYAGAYVDEAAGGLMRVGFTANQAASIASLEQEAGLIAPARVAGFSSAPTNSLAALEAAEAGVATADASYPVNLIVSYGVDVVANTVAVGATNVAEAKSRLEGSLGPGAPITVSFSEPLHQTSKKWKKATGPILAGDFVRSGHGGGCSAGFGAFTRKNGKKVYLLLSAAHCGDIGQSYHRESESGELKPLGPVVRSGWDPKIGITVADGEAIKVEAPNEAPTSVNLGGRGSTPVKGVEALFNLGRGRRLCHSGARSEARECGKLTKVKAKDVDQKTGRYGLERCFDANIREGDSGGPVWIEGTHTAVGLATGGYGKEVGKETFELTCVTPLFPGHGLATNAAILTNEGMTPIHLRLSGH